MVVQRRVSLECVDSQFPFNIADAPSPLAGVAIWTGSQKLTACRCLFELELGLVGPSLVGPNLDQAELLHPKLVALWAREDIGLTPKDYVSYVSIVKNFDKLWRYLVSRLCPRSAQRD